MDLEIEKKKNLALEISLNVHLKKDQKPLWKNQLEVLKNQNPKMRDMVEKIRLVLMTENQTDLLMRENLVIFQTIENLVIFQATENQISLQRTEDQINFLEMVKTNFDLDPKKDLKLNLKAAIMLKKVVLLSVTMQKAIIGIVNHLENLVLKNDLHLEIEMDLDQEIKLDQKKSLVLL